MKKQVNRELEASITVEASLVLPIFILAMYTFIFLIQVFMVVEYVDQGLLETARYFEKIGYVYDYINNYEDNKEKCNYKRKRQLKAFLLELFVTYGSGHFYTENYMFPYLY